MEPTSYDILGASFIIIIVCFFSVSAMRWKLIVLVSLVAAVIALGLWSAFTITVFGSARVLAQNGRSLIVNIDIANGVTTFVGIFVHRHKAKRRKLQVLIATLLVLLLSAGLYLIASYLLASRLYIPRTYEVRHAR